MQKEMVIRHEPDYVDVFEATGCVACYHREIDGTPFCCCCDREITESEIRDSEAN